MTDLASLGLRIDSSEVGVGASKLDQLTAAGGRAERQSEKLTSAQRTLAAETRGANAATQLFASTLGTLGAAYIANEVKRLADSYTSYTNQLKVAGLEGVRLAKTQEDLFKVAQRYGVELQSLGTLYGRVASSGKELGASQADLLKFTTGVAAALKIQGGSAASSAGALLQLSQMLGGVKVQAQEYNSIVDGARPILQAVAAGSDRFKGSLGKLRQEVNDGKVTSREFFEAFLKGMGELEARAAKANLTIAASFTILDNALGKYVGETDKQLSATQHLSEAIISVSKNLDTIVPALAVVISYVGVRWAAAGAQFIATEVAKSFAIAQTAATMAMEARAADLAAAANARLAAAGGAATVSAARFTTTVGAGAIAVQGARGVLGSLVGFMGGPWGIAFTLAAGAVYLLVQHIRSLDQPTRQVAQANAALTQALSAYENAAFAASTASDKNRESALKEAAAARQAAIQKRDEAAANIQLAKSALAALAARNAEAIQNDRYNFRGDAAGTVRPILSQDAQRRQQANIDAAAKAVADANKAIASADNILNVRVPAAVAPALDEDAKKTKKKKEAVDAAAKALAEAQDQSRQYVLQLEAENAAVGLSEYALKSREIALQSMIAQANGLPDEAKQIEETGAALLRRNALYEMELQLKERIRDLAQSPDDSSELERAKDYLEILSRVDEQTRSAAAKMAESWGGVGAAIGDLTVALSNYGKTKAAIDAKLAEDSVGKYGLELTKLQTRAVQEHRQAELESYGDMARAAKGFFNEKTRGYAVMEAAEKGFRAIELALAVKAMATDLLHTAASSKNSFIRAAAHGVEAVAKAIASLPFPLNLAAGAATAAALAAIGVKVLGGGAGGGVPGANDAQTRQDAQGAGSVLGSAGAKSESITKALELAAANSNKDLEYSNGMLKALRSIDSQIGVLTSALARQLSAGGALDTSGLGLGSGTTKPTLGQTLLAGPMALLLPGLFGGTKSTTLQDQGLRFGSQSLEAIMAGGLQGQSYQQVLTQTTKKFLGITYSNKSNSSTTTGALDGDLTAELQRVIASLRDGVLAAAGALGIEGAEATLKAFQVNLGTISFKDMDASQIREALNAVFGKVGDEMAASIDPIVSQLQKAGEGAFESLVRLAREYQVVDVTLQSIGKTFGAVGISSVEARDRLVQMVGGLDALTEQTNFFAEHFLSKAEQMAPVQAAVTRELERLGLAGTTTKDQFKSLVLGLDLSSEAGASMYAALMALAPAFAKVTDYADELAQAGGDVAGPAGSGVDPAVAKARRAMEIQIMELQDNAAGALIERRKDELAALDASLRPYQQRIYDLQDEKTALEAAAVAAEKARQITSQGRQLEIQLMELQGNASGALAARRQIELAALDPTLVAIQRQIYAAQDLADASNAAASAIAAARTAYEASMNLQIRLARAEGNTDRATQLERQLELSSATDEGTRATLRAIYAFEDYTVAVQQYEAGVASAKDKLSAAYERESSALTQTIDRLRTMASSLRDFRDELDMGSLGDIPAAARRAMLLDALNQAAVLAKAGDATAAGNIPQLSRDYLAIAKETAGSATEYAIEVARVREVVSDTQAVAETQADVAQAQLEQLKTTVGALIDINTSVLSVRDAIAALQLARAGAPTAPVVSGTRELPAVLGNDLWRLPQFGGPGADYDKLEAAVRSKMATITDKTSDAYMGLVFDLSAIDAARNIERENAIARGAISGFDVGGDFTVPGSGGPDSRLVSMMLTPGEKVSIRNGRGAGGANDNSAAQEIRALRAEVRDLKTALETIATNTGGEARIIKRWDNDGLPATRS